MLTSQKVTEIKIESITKMEKSSIDAIICNGVAFSDHVSLKIINENNDNNDTIRTHSIVMPIEEFTTLIEDLTLFHEALKSGGVDGL